LLFVLTVLDGVAIENRLCIEIYLSKGLFMYQKLFIGMMIVCVLAACGSVAEAAPAALAPAIHPLAHIAMWVITAITIFL